MWKTSGHYKNYKDNLFLFKVENAGYGMKPMNCPGHCLMFDNEIRSYKDLPIRLADFGVLHRNEISGALSGLNIQAFHNRLDSELNKISQEWVLIRYAATLAF